MPAFICLKVSLLVLIRKFWHSQFWDLPETSAGTSAVAIISLTPRLGFLTQTLFKMPELTNMEKNHFRIAQKRITGAIWSGSNPAGAYDSVRSVRFLTCRRFGIPILWHPKSNSTRCHWQLQSYHLKTTEVFITLYHTVPNFRQPRNYWNEWPR